MSITVLNYMDQALVDRIHSQAAKRAETAKQTTSDDFATVLADSTKAIENNQNTIGIGCIFENRVKLVRSIRTCG